jgi:regulator of replication initiation timing
MGKFSQQLAAPVVVPKAAKETSRAVFKLQQTLRLRETEITNLQNQINGMRGQGSPAIDQLKEENRQLRLEVTNIKLESLKYQKERDQYKKERDAALVQMAKKDPLPVAVPPVG